MKVRVANCPSCGAPVEFKTRSSLVTVCEFCHSCVGRGDKAPEDFGKVADLAELNSPLMLGMSGKYRDKKFDVVGRVQYDHPSGAKWNEWYLLFGGETWGWLAEAQGRFYMTFEKRLKSDTKITPFDSVQIGEAFALMKSQLTVSEKAVAHVYSAEGEIPWEVRPGAEHPYADLRGEDGVFATLDYSTSPPTVFVGYAVAPESLELSGRIETYGGEATKISAIQVNCPKCAGQLSLHAPDASLRVTCPNCNSMLECDHGNLTYLTTLAKRQVTPQIPLDTKGSINGEEYTIIGFMERYVMYQGTAYSWAEYLLYHRLRGYRWLVNNQGHWSFVETIDYPVGDTTGRAVTYKGRTFLKYDQGTAHVRSVIGEFPWRVHMGEHSDTVDYISPPYMLSFESSIQIQSPKTQNSKGKQAYSSVANQEVTVSLGTYMPIEDVEKAFGVKSLARPFSVGPIQPPPPIAGFIGLHVLFAMIIIFIHMGFAGLHPTKPPDFFVAIVALGLVSIIPVMTYVYRYTFDVKRWENSDYSPYAQD